MSQPVQSDRFRVPEGIRRRYSRWSWSVAYHHQPEAVTWRLESAAGLVRYLKVVPASEHARLAGEVDRTRWAGRYLPVPKVIESGADETFAWLMTAELPGRDATDEDHRVNPARLVRLLAAGLRRFHSTPADGCPFEFGAPTAIAQVRARVGASAVNPAVDFHPEHRGLDARSALVELERLRPDVEDIVVCHGDYCLPNVMVTDGAVTGFLDLGRLGLADRWWDLAVGSWSISWNLGPGWEDLFFSAYGIPRDDRRLAFYRLLYDLA